MINKYLDESKEEEQGLAVRSGNSFRISNTKDALVLEDIVIMVVQNPTYRFEFYGFSSEDHEQYCAEKH